MSDDRPVRDERVIARRTLLMKLGLALNVVVVAALSAPFVAYILSPLIRKTRYLQWVSLGQLENFPEGETRLATFTNPFKRPWDGVTLQTACWVRRMQGTAFEVFAINCAHLGCPVRWFAQSGLFMCPCHGGVYYADGSVAAGPPPRGLFKYPNKLQEGELLILAGQLPTLSTKP
ncbi:MAG: ubiquinol-cytochrome c reductase iron-sulfur subunit [Candidatus Acidiferrales bacterium]